MQSSQFSKKHNRSKFHFYNLLKIICVLIYLFRLDYIIRYFALLNLFLNLDHSSPPWALARSFPLLHLLHYVSLFTQKCLGHSSSSYSLWSITSCRQLSWDSWGVDSSSFCFCFDITTTWKYNRCHVFIEDDFVLQLPDMFHLGDTKQYSALKKENQLAANQS